MIHVRYNLRSLFVVNVTPALLGSLLGSACYLSLKQRKSIQSVRATFAFEVEEMHLTFSSCRKWL